MQRIIAIETSSVRGSVALAEGGRGVVDASHERENAHVETLFQLIERVLADAGWTKSSLSRVAVGVGPGSFTGLRVGIALAQGMAEGLEIPLVGVGSLAAMALAVPPEVDGLRCPVLDARRGEVFFGLYSADGVERHPPSVARPEALPRLVPAGVDVTWVGGGCQLVPGVTAPFFAPGADLPHARWTALAAASAPIDVPVRALYLREGVSTPPLAITRPS